CLHRSERHGRGRRGRRRRAMAARERPRRRRVRHQRTVGRPSRVPAPRRAGISAGRRDAAVRPRGDRRDVLHRARVARRVRVGRRAVGRESWVQPGSRTRFCAIRAAARRVLTRRDLARRGAILSLSMTTDRNARAFRTIAVIVFGLLIAFGCVLRFWKLSNVGLWYDELWTVVGASNRPFGEMYREWILGDSHPPGFFLFYFAWLKLVPATEFWTRLPSAVAGVLTVVYLLWGTRRVLSRDERLCAAAFVSLSYVYVFYALSVKQYSAMLLFITIATITYLDIVAARQLERRQAVTLGAASVALAYLNHFGMVYAAMLFAMLFATFRGDRTVRPHIARLAAVCAIAYAPIVPFLYLQLKYNIDGWQPYQVGTFLANLTPSLFFNDPTVVWLALAVLALTLVARAARDRRVREQLWTIRNRHIVFIVVAFGTFMLVLGAVRPIFYVRYFLAMMPAVLLGLAVATAAAFPLDRRWAAIALLAFFSRAAVTQFRTIDALQREQWDKSVDLVLASHAPAD